MTSVDLFAAALVAVSVVMIVSHWREWRGESQIGSDASLEQRFAWAKCRRRTQASGMIGLIGVMMACYRWVPKSNLAVSLYLLGMLLLVAWVILLAAGDALATRQHFVRLRRRQVSSSQNFLSEWRQSHHEDGDERPSDSPASSP